MNIYRKAGDFSFGDWDSRSESESFGCYLSIHDPPAIILHEYLQCIRINAVSKFTTPEKYDKIFH